MLSVFQELFLSIVLIFDRASNILTLKLDFCANERDSVGGKKKLEICFRYSGFFSRDRGD